MLTRKIGDIDVIVNGCDDMPELEILGYIAYIRKQLHPGNIIRTVIITLDPDADKDSEIVLDYNLAPRQFERIHRITGYLVGSDNRWNNAKRAELADRVKHIR